MRHFERNFILDWDWRGFSRGSERELTGKAGVYRQTVKEECSCQQE